MSAQTPLQCKNVESSNWMYNDQDQSPCQVLSSSLHQFDTTFNLTWLDLSFTCPMQQQGPSNHTNTTTLSEYCCSSVSFSLFSSCWACQWDQPVAGHVRTTWGNYSSPCLSNSTTATTTTTTTTGGASSSSRGILAATTATTTRIGTLSSAVQSALTAANIHIPNWAFMPVTNNSTWDELAAQSNATVVASSSTATQSNQFTSGAIVGISIGSFIAFCTLVFIFTILCIQRNKHKHKQEQRQRHRLETFRHRSLASFFFGHKRRAVHEEKTVGVPEPVPVGAREGARERGRGRGAQHDMTLAALDDDGFVSPISFGGGGGGGMMGAHRDLTVDISPDHDAMHHPGFLGSQRLETPGSSGGVGGFPRSPERRRTQPETGGGGGGGGGGLGLGLGAAARFQTNVRRSLARLGRRSQPERTDSQQHQHSHSHGHGLEHTTTTNNRHTHLMTQISSLDGSPSFAVPFSSSDQTANANWPSGRRLPHSAPPSSWPIDATFDTSTAHPLTEQQLHPQLSRNRSVPPSSTNQQQQQQQQLSLLSSSLSAANKVTPMPLTKEALSLARVAQDGTLFVLGEPELLESRPVQQQQQQQQQQGEMMVRTVSLDRNPAAAATAQMHRHANVLPGRSDSLRRSRMHQETSGTSGTGTQRQGQQLGLVLHEAVMDGTIPRRKTPSRQRRMEDRGEGTSAQQGAASTSRTSPPVLLGFRGGGGVPTTSASQPTTTTTTTTTSQRGISTFIGSLRAPIARKATAAAVPKSDSSVVANAGSAMGSNGELSYVDEENESIAAPALGLGRGTRYTLATSATGTSGSTGTGSANGRGGGGRRNGKKRGRENRDLRLSLVPTTATTTSPSSGTNVGGGGGVKSDGTRTPSPKVAPSAEWFDLFRRGTVPMIGGGGGGGGPLSPDQKRQAFQPNALAGPSMSTFQRAHSADSAAALYPGSVGALYPSSAASFLSSMTGPSSARSGLNTGTVQRQSSTQNVPETAAAPSAWTTTTPRSTATVQPSLARAPPPVSPPSAFRYDDPQPPPSGSQPVSLPSTPTVYQTQPSPVSNLPPNTSTAAAAAPHSRRQSQRPLSSAPLPIPPPVPISFTTEPPPRVVPAGARPIRRLPAIPPQPPPPS